TDYFISISFESAMKYLAALFIVFAQMLQAQTILLNDDFEFKEGVYLSLNEFNKNAPSINLEDVELIFDEEYSNAQIKRITIVEKKNDITEFVWALQFDNGLFIRLEPTISAHKKNREISSENIF